MATTQVKNGYQGGSEDQWFIKPSGAGLVEVSNPGGGGSSWQNFGQATPSTVTVDNTSTQLLAANPNRLYASFTNNTDQTIYLQYSSDAVFGRGYPVRPNSVWVIDEQTLYTGIVNAITNAGSVDIDVIEGIE